MSSGLVCVLLVLVLLSEWLVSGTAPGWLRMVGIEIQAACRDTGTQWMVVACLVSYFGTFLFLEWRLFQPQKNPENTKGKTPSPPSVFRSPTSISAFLAFFRGNVSNPDFWLTGLVGMVLLRYAFAYETAARSLQPLVLLVGIVFGKGVALWARSLKSKVQGLKLGGDASSGCATFSPSEAERVSAPSSLNHQLSTFNRTQAILSILVFLLAASALWQPEYGMDFQYRGQRRWTGPWDNPNLYGLLMGVGTVLAVGLFFSRLKAKDSSRPGAECPPFNYQLKTIHYAQGLLLLAAAGLCAYGLVKSYSRGAWLGTACGLLYLAWQRITHPAHELQERPSPSPPGGRGERAGVRWVLLRHRLQALSLSCSSNFSPVRSLWLPLAVLLASVLALSFWQFRHTENPLARRVFSVGNLNDFSWRNRVATWSGAVTMMKDRPWVGHGWGKAETVFREQYKPVRLEDAAALQMNDYLMLGISGGVLALLCLLGYLWLVLMRCAEWGVRSGEPPDSVGLQPSDLSLQPSVIAAAGATVLLVGFWFDGGLFKLPTGAVFWLLVELARIFPLPASGHPLPVRRGEGQGEGHGSSPRQIQIGLRWLAGVLALLAIGQTALHLGTPRLAVSERSLSIARQFLVPPKAKKDFEFQAAEPIWSAKKLATLLEHVELANYNRELVNWKLADDVYHRFVLSPPIDPALDGDMNWRRPLWESFYPRIRKENSLEAAAEIIVRLLRERVRVGETPGSPETIAKIWQRGIASERGFEAIYVAALRSAGIPARLAERGRAEFWNGAEWQPFH